MLMSTFEGALQRTVFLIHTSPMTRNDVALHNVFFLNYLNAFKSSLKPLGLPRTWSGLHLFVFDTIALYE